MTGSAMEGLMHSLSFPQGFVSCSSLPHKLRSPLKSCLHFANKTRRSPSCLTSARPHFHAPDSFQGRAIPGCSREGGELPQQAPGSFFFQICLIFPGNPASNCKDASPEPAWKHSAPEHLFITSTTWVLDPKTSSPTSHPAGKYLPAAQHREVGRFGGQLPLYGHFKENSRLKSCRAGRIESKCNI